MLTTFCIFFMFSFSILTCYAIAYYVHGRPIYCKSNKRLDGKTVVITGGSGGIGREIVRELANRGACVIIGSRNQARAASNVLSIREQTNNHQVFYLPLDLTDFESVKAFANYISSTQPSLHILINNAGIAADYEDKTKDGYDHVFTANYLGHFLLTYLLLDLIRSSAPSRIINVSSVAHSMVNRDLKLSVNDSKHGDNMYPHLEGYDISKLALILHVKELTRRLSGSGVTANAVNPGPCLTGFWYQTGSWWPSYLAFITRWVLRPIFQSPCAAAQTTVYCALDDSLEGISGKYFFKCGLQKESKLSQDIDLARDLWDISLLLTGCSNGKVVSLLPSFRYIDEEEDWQRRIKKFNRELKRKKEEPQIAPETLHPIDRS